MDQEKKILLRRILREMESALVTLSGGIDSTLLAKLAHEELGDRAAALTAVSPSLARAELAEATEIARQIGIRHLLVDTNEMQNPAYTSNPGNRCFFCKTELFDVAHETARREGIRWVLEGTHVEDLKGHRPGYQAAQDHGVRSPFIEAGFGKQDIREFAQDLGIAIWDKPAMACLSSRFPTGTEITLDRLALIDRVEEAVRTSGLRQFRARYHDSWIRIEVGEEEFTRLSHASLRSQIDERVKELGFEKVVLDLIPYGAPRGSGLSLPANAGEVEERVRAEFFEETGAECAVNCSDEMLALLPAEGADWGWLSDSGRRNGLLRGLSSTGRRHVGIDLSAALPAGVRIG